MALKLVIFVTLAVAAVHAQIPGFGSCPEYKPVADFDIKRFLGTWFENQRYFTLTEVGTRCGRIEYSQTPNGKFVAANTITSRLTGVTRVVNGELKLASDSKEGRLSIRYDQLPLAYNSEYSVVATDYDSYAILWSCSAPLPYLLSTQNAWLMTRESDPNAKTLEVASAEFDKLGISTRFISRVDQKSCTEAANAAAAAAAGASTTVAPATAAPVTTAPSATVITTAAPAADDTPQVRHAVHDQQIHVKSVPAVAEVVKKPVVDAMVAETKPIVNAVKAEPEAATAEPEPEPVKIEEAPAAAAPEPEPVATAVKVEEAKPVEAKKPIKPVEKKKQE